MNWHRESRPNKPFSWALGDSERADLVDADEPFWAFAASGCVGSVVNLHVRPLALTIATNSR